MEYQPAVIFTTKNEKQQSESKRLYLKIIAKYLLHYTDVFDITIWTCSYNICPFWKPNKFGNIYFKVNKKTVVYWWKYNLRTSMKLW